MYVLQHGRCCLQRHALPAVLRWEVWTAALRGLACCVERSGVLHWEVWRAALRDWHAVLRGLACCVERLVCCLAHMAWSGHHNIVSYFDFNHFFSIMLTSKVYFERSATSCLVHPFRCSGLIKFLGGASGVSTDISNVRSYRVCSHSYLMLNSNATKVLDCCHE